MNDLPQKPRVEWRWYDADHKTILYQAIRDGATWERVMELVNASANATNSVSHKVYSITDLSELSHFPTGNIMYLRDVMRLPIPENQGVAVVVGVRSRLVRHTFDLFASSYASKRLLEVLQLVDTLDAAVQTISDAKRNAGVDGDR